MPETLPEPHYTVTGLAINRWGGRQRRGHILNVWRAACELNTFIAPELVARAAETWPLKADVNQIIPIWLRWFELDKLLKRLP